MCTVSFIPTDSGYLLAMNRDESISRVRAVEPRVFDYEDGWLLRPSEPSGGTWISLNSSGLSLALLNWYAASRRVSDCPVSRGDLVSRLGVEQNSERIAAAISKADHSSTNPFRLICFDSVARTADEWRWNLESLERVRFGWEKHQWASSGFDEVRAQRERKLVFERKASEPDAGSVAWLRSLHASHEPERGAFSHCVHREDARTVSFTEISVEGQRACMSYHDGPPCEDHGLQSVEARIKLSGGCRGA